MLRQNAEVDIAGTKVQARLDALTERYRTALDQHASAWLATAASDPQATAALLGLGTAVQAQQLLAEQEARVRKLAAEQERAATLAKLQQLPASVLVITHFPVNLPKSLAKHIDELVQPAIDQLGAKLGSIPVVRAGKGLPPGASGLAAGIVELQFTCEYAAYGKGDNDFEAQLNETVPTTLTVHLTGRRGLSFSLALDATISASAEAPQEMKGGYAVRTAIAELAEQHAKTLIDEVAKGYPSKIPTYDTAAFQAAIAAHPVAVGDTPLLLVTVKTQVGRDKASGQLIAATGSDALEQDLIDNFARRLAPVRMTRDTTAPVTGQLLIDTTIWYQNYGHKEGGLHFNNGGLPYRIDVAATLDDQGTARHPWAGVHRYRALVDLPETLSHSSGEFYGEALHSIGALTAQVGGNLDGEVLAMHAYQPATAGQADEYLLRIVPVGAFAGETISTAITTQAWYTNLPTYLGKALANRLGSARLVTSDQVTTGRLAGTLEVYVDGSLTAVHPGNGVPAVYHPAQLTLDLHLTSSYRGTPHAWEGAHPLALKFSEVVLLQKQQRHIADPFGDEFIKQVQTAIH